MKQFKQLREDALMEKLKASAPTAEWIHDFVHSKNPKFAGKSKKERINMALGAAYAAKRNEEVEQIEELSKDTLDSFIKKSKETYKDVPDTKKGNRLRNTLKAAGKSDAKNEEVELKESYEEAEEHLSKANDADAKGDKMGYHYHMADHHDALSQWHESKGRSATADKHAEKADYHSDKYTEHANGMHEAINPAQQAAIAIAIKKKKKKMMEADETLNEKFWDNEGEMVISQCKTIAAKAQMIMSMLDDESKLEAWVQGKMTTAEIAINSVHDHLMYSDDAIDEATGDKSFDSVMKNIVTGTSKQRTADRIAQKKQNQEQARNAFGGMFGGGNPADKLKIKEDFDQIDEVSTSTLVSYRKKANQDITAKTLNIAAKMGSGRFPPLDGVEKDIAKKQSRIASATKASQKLHIKGYVEPARPKTPDNGDRGYGKGRYMGDSVELDGDALDEKEVWDKPNPKKTHHKLTSAQVSKARAKARAAGRPYPNLVDNMAVMKEDAVEEAYKGAGSSALKLADRIRQERLKREASEKRAQEMLGKKTDEKKEVK